MEEKQRFSENASHHLNWAIIKLLNQIDILNCLWKNISVYWDRDPTFLTQAF